MAGTLGQVLGVGHLLGCRTVPAAPSRWRRFDADGLRVVVTGRGDASFVEGAVRAALPRVDRYQLRPARPVQIEVHAGVAGFARATGQTESWMRAWSTYEVIHLLPLDTWRDPSAGAQIERLAHELAHLGCFQRLGPEVQARRVGVPFWFREGVASVVAEQAARRMPLPLLLERSAGRDPLRAPADAAEAYGAAHHAMAALVALKGEAIFGALLDAARADGEAGALPRVFPAVTGLALGALWSVVVERAAGA